MWHARVFDEQGEPKTIIVKGDFRHHNDVKRYLKIIHPEYKYIRAVKI